MGIFGFGFSLNDNLDLLNLVVLAVAGIIIALFFQENYSQSGTSGPASTIIWGYGLTALSLFLMIFMNLYLSKSKNDYKTTPGIGILEDKDTNLLKTVLNVIMNDTLPIMLTFGIVIYIIYLNFTYYTRINSNNVTNSYKTYSLFSSILMIIQVGIIIKYMFNSLSKRNEGAANNQNEIIKSFAFLLVTINFIFVMIMHILLAFYSTDG